MLSLRVHRSFKSCVLIAAVAAAGTHVAVDAADSVYVAAWASDSVVQFDTSNGDVIGSLAFFPGFDGPLGMTLGPDGLLYTTSELTNQVVVFDPHSGTFHGVFASAVDGLDSPSGIVFGPDVNGDGVGDAYIASFTGDSIAVHDGVTGDFISTFVTPGSGGLNGPDAGFAFGPDGDLYVPSYWTNRVIRYNGTTGAAEAVFIPQGSGGMARPRTILFLESGNTVLVSCESTDRVVEYNATTGAFIRVLVSIDAPTGLAIDVDGTLLVASANGNLVNRYNLLSGQLMEQVVAPGAGGIQAPTFLVVVPEEVEPVCSGDVNEDGVVDVNDLLALLSAWGPCEDCGSDLNDDDVVDVVDLLAMLAAWGPCVG